MIKQQFYIKLLSIIICLFPFLAYGNYAITPVQLVIKEDSKITSLTLKNNQAEEKKFQLVVYKVVNNHGKETLIPTKDLLVTPVIFKIPAGQSQLIRVAVKDVMYNHQKDGYRLAVKELPTPLVQEGNHVQFTVVFNVPISIESTTAETEIK